MMANHESRGRIELSPLGADQRMGLLADRFPLPAGATALAEIATGDRGWLVRFDNTGRLAVWDVRGVLRSVDQRKAAAALAAIGAAGT